MTNLLNQNVIRWMNAETGEVKERAIWDSETYADGTTESWPQPAPDLAGALLGDLLDVLEVTRVTGRTIEIHITYRDVK